MSRPRPTVEALFLGPPEERRVCTACSAEYAPREAFLRRDCPVARGSDHWSAFHPCDTLQRWARDADGEQATPISVLHAAQMAAPGLRPEVVETFWVEDDLNDYRRAQHDDMRHALLRLQVAWCDARGQAAPDEEDAQRWQGFGGDAVPDEGVVSIGEMRAQARRLGREEAQARVRHEVGLNPEAELTETCFIPFAVTRHAFPSRDR